MHPTDAQTLFLEKNANEDYYYGSPDRSRPRTRPCGESR